MSGVGTPTWTSVPARSRAKKACSITFGFPTASMQTSAPLPPGEGADRLDGIGGAGVDRVGGAERGGQLELSGVQVDADDGGRPGQLRPGHGGTPDTAAAEDGHRVAEPDLAGEHGRAQTRHHAAARAAPPPRAAPPG